MFLRKSVLKICSKFTGEHSCRSAISIKLQNNFIEITRRYACSPVNLLHILRTHFPSNTSGWLFLILCKVAFHYVKSVQIRRYFWSVFSCIRTEYGEILLLCTSPYSVRIQENMDQK